MAIETNVDSSDKTVLQNSADYVLLFFIIISAN